MIVLDTNVFSEALKPAPSDKVLQWLRQQNRAQLFLTAITVAEVFAGLESMPQGRRHADLLGGVEALLATTYAGRILPFDDSAARIFAGIVSERKALGRRILEMDAMIAAIARANHFAVATRNTADFEHCGVRLVNPWTAAR